MSDEQSMLNFLTMERKMETKVTLTLDINQLNTVMAGLARMPYEQVFQLIGVIQQQVGPQVQQAQPSDAPLADKVIQ